MELLILERAQLLLKPHW